MRNTIHGSDGTLKAICDNLEYHSSWMGEEYVSADISSCEPIELQIGDYLLYRGEMFRLYSLPTTLKQSSAGSYGEAFVYNGVKFSSMSAELAEIRFLDVVLNDNELHYTGLSDFSFYAATVDDLLDRILANSDRSGETPWVVVSPSYQRTMQRYPEGDSRRVTAQALWEQTFGSEHTEPTYDKTDVNISISGKSVREALTYIHDSFGLFFVTRGRALIVGGEGTVANHIFQYGKGNGLSSIERTADVNQQVVTKLFAYGSDKNMPARYYANLNRRCFTRQEAYADTEIVTFLYWNADLFTTPAYGRADSYEVTVEIGGTSYIAIAYSSVYNGESMVTLIGLSSTLPSTDGKIYFTAGYNKSKWPSSSMDYSMDVLPNNLAVSFLMLPGFPNYSLSEICRSRFVSDSAGGRTLYDIRKTPTDGWSTFMEIAGNHPVRFSDEKLRPYLVSPNIDVLGTKEGEVIFKEENDDNGLKEVYPTISEMTVGDVFGTQSTERLDEVLAVDTISDNGVYDGDSKVKNFKITLKNLGFDLSMAFRDAGNSMTISFIDGYCGGRDFSVKGVTKKEGNTWELNVERVYDEALDLWFPYSDHVAHGSVAVADEPYQIRQGDHFVLTGIDIVESSYIWAASVKALRKAITWLLNNDYTRFTYSPKVDNIFMAYEHTSSAAGTSLHDTLKSGMLMQFEDADLDIDGSVFIDSLTIKEDGDNGIPTYDIVLRNDKQIGYKQSVQNQLNALSSSLSSGGGLTIPQVRSLIANYGISYFLSKLADDTAQGFISFVKGLAVKGKNLLDIIRSTDGLTDSDEAVLSEKRSLATFLRKDKEDSTDHHVTFGDGITTPNAGSSDFVSGEKGWRIYEQNGKSYLEVDNIEARGVFRATVLDIKRRTYSAGTIVGNMANGNVVRVTPLDSSGVSMGVFVYGLNIGNDQWLAVTVREEDGTTYNVAGEEVAVTGTAAAYKIDFLRSDDEVTVTNDWHIGDMARCQEINVQSREMGGGVVLNRNRSWWRVVTAVGTETLPDGRECAYIIVSNAGTALESYDASEHPSGRQANQITVSDGINTVTCWAFDDRLPNDAPMIGDDVCQEGHVFNENDGRQNLKVDKIEDLSLTWYQGIGYDKSDVGHQFSLDVNQPLRVSPEGVVVQAGKFYLGSPIPSNQIENKILTRRWLNKTTSQIYVPRNSSGDLDIQFTLPDSFTVTAKRQTGNDAPVTVGNALIVLYGYDSPEETTELLRVTNGVLTIDQDLPDIIDAGYTQLRIAWEENNTDVDAVEITIVIQGEKGEQGQQGQQGIQGPKGDDGNGVELKGSVDVLYNADITGSETSLEGLTGISIGDCYVVDANRHLYFYNGSSVAFPGNWNDLGEFKGEPGRGVVDIVEYYKATNSNTPMSRPSSDTGWDTDPNLSHLTDQWDANHIYLWNYERTEYSSGTQYERTVPKIIAIWTKDGKGITSIQNKYAITPTNVTPAKEGTQGAPTWYNSPIEPTSANPYLWNYEVVQWTEGNSTSTDVHLLCKYGKDAEFYRFKPIIETAAAYLPKDSTTGKLTTSRKVRLNLQYWVYRVVGDMETRVMNLSGFKMKYLRNGALVPTSGYIEPTGNTTDGQYFNVSVDDSYTQNEGKTIDTILYKVTGTAPSQTVTELDRRIVPLVFDAQTVFQIDTEKNEIRSIVQGHTTQIQQQATEISQTKDAIELTAMRSGTDNLVRNSMIGETSSAYGFANRTGISLVAAKKYTLSFNGRISSDASVGGASATLRVYVFRKNSLGEWLWNSYAELDTTTDSTASVTFTCPLTSDDYEVMAFMHPSGGDRAGNVTLNWVKLEEGETATEYHSDADSAYAKMKITSDAIEQEVNGTKTRLDAGGFTVTGDTKFEGDVTMEGTLTGKTTYLEDSNLPPDMTILDMKEKSSVTVSARRAADDTIPTLILPMWNKFGIDDSAATSGRVTPEYRIEGTRITITNPYNPDYATWRWFEDNSQNAGRFNTYGLGLLKHCVLIVADPRLVSKRMYDGDNSNNDYTIRMWLPEDATPTHWKDAEGGDHYGISEPIPADGYYDVVVSWRPKVNGDNDSLDSYKLEKMQGNFICEGIRGRQLLLLPGQSVELVSRKGNVVSGDWNADYLYWQVVNAKEFESIKMWFRQSVSQSGSPLAPVWGEALENQRWTVGTDGFSESGDQYQSAIFSAPQMGNGYAQPTSGTYPERQLDFDLVANQIRANEYDDQ